METRLNLVGRHTLAESIEEENTRVIHTIHSFKHAHVSDKGSNTLALQTAKNKPKVLLEKVPRNKINTTIYEKYSLRHIMQLKLTPALRKRETRREMKESRTVSHTFT